MPDVVAAIYTCGRKEYLQRTLASYRNRVTGPVTRTVIFDDSGDPTFRAWLDDLDFGPLSIASWGENRGYSASLGLSWLWIGLHTVEPFVFHLEEDFTFDRPVDLSALASILDARPHLDQVALLRGPWYPKELRAGGIIEQDPEAYTQRRDGERAWMEHTKCFTVNPCLYRRTLCAEGWPQEPRSERVFTSRRRDAGKQFAYLGSGEPWVTHIGEERTGHGY